MLTCEAKCLLVWCSQAVAYAQFGHDVLWSFWISLNFAAQLADIDAQVLRIGRFVPQFLDQEPVGEHLARMLHEQAQKVIFLGRESHFLVTHLDNAPDQINAQVADLEEGSLTVFLQLMAHSRTDAGKELIHSEWLGNVIVGAEIEGCNLTGLIATAG